MLPDWVSNPEPLTYESGALPIALRGPAHTQEENRQNTISFIKLFTGRKSAKCKQLYKIIQISFRSKTVLTDTDMKKLLTLN